ncbi:MAG: type II toxin-antitoxin system VapC family toxin [Acidobacteriota bacterium]
MILYVLDTDHLSLYQRGNAPIAARLARFPGQQTAMSLITAEELMRGRLARIRASRDENECIQAYKHLRETIGLISSFRLLDYDTNASVIYESLRQQKLRVGTQDLRIAAVALAHSATVVTRNQQHFGQVSGLKLEDWTK